MNFLPSCVNVAFTFRLRVLTLWRLPLPRGRGRIPAGKRQRAIRALLTSPADRRQCGLPF